jgi:methyl-accepting chemotaxis protein/CHASE3 domain sensor protein
MKNWTIGKRLIGGFSAVLIVTVALGCVAYWSGQQIAKKSEVLAYEVAPVAVDSSSVCSSAMEAVFQGRGYFLYKEDRYLTDTNRLLDQAITSMQSIASLARERGNTELATRASEAARHGANYKAKLNDYFDLRKSFDAEAAKMGPRGAAVSEQIDGFNVQQHELLEQAISSSEDSTGTHRRLEVIAHVPELTKSLTAARVATALYINTHAPADLERAVSNLDGLRKETQTVLGLTTQETERQYLEQALRAIDAYGQGLAQLLEIDAAMVANDKERAPMYGQLLATAKKEQADANEQVKTSSVASVAAAERNNMMMLIGMAAAVAVGVVLVALITRSITRALKRVIDSLTEGAEQTATASGQVSSASQTLAEGASEAAASIEETTSSVEEMSSMTKQNAANAKEADGLMQEAGAVVQRGQESMTRLNGAIGEIKASADETAKIVKTIDEIAFQTNLLALNAAVEAARAGEAGKGFAVVAEEVRNLAQRSAEAAKTTSDLIKQSVTNAENGVTIATDTGQAFHEITESANKATQLVSEIAAASNEQSQGIEQINIAITQMDQVTQSNAANAEESASAAEELSAQAAELKSVVGELQKLVGGSAALVHEARFETDAAKAHPHQRQARPAQAARKHRSAVQEDSSIPLEEQESHNSLSEF